MSPFGLFKGSCHNWCKVLMMISVKLLAFFNSLTSQTREEVLIIDDSPYDRSRSKKVELWVRVVDHAEKKLGLVVGTGMQTELGRISDMAEGAKKETTPLQKRLDQLGRRLAWITISIAAVCCLKNLKRAKYRLIRNR
jgi:magnesium-transporting ATPase (P-type)